MDIVITEAIALRDALTRRAVDSIDIPITGRTHGMHAEPTTFGAKFALFALQVQRDVERARHARTSIAVGKLSGAVGTFSNIDPAVEKYVCSRLGLEAVPATQVIARDRHAEVLYACASLGTAIEQFALEVRHLARSEVGEAEESFTSARRDRRDAAQAQPRSLGTTVRAQSGTAGIPASRTRGRRPLARA